MRKNLFMIISENYGRHSQYVCPPRLTYLIKVTFWEMWLSAREILTRYIPLLTLRPFLSLPSQTRVCFPALSCSLRSVLINWPLRLYKFARVLIIRVISYHKWNIWVSKIRDSYVFNFHIEFVLSTSTTWILTIHNRFSIWITEIELIINIISAQSNLDFPVSEQEWSYNMQFLQYRNIHHLSGLGSQYLHLYMCSHLDQFEKYLSNSQQ